MDWKIFNSFQSIFVCWVPPSCVLLAQLSTYPLWRVLRDLATRWFFIYLLVLAHVVHRRKKSEKHRCLSCHWDHLSLE